MHHQQTTESQFSALLLIRITYLLQASTWFTPPDAPCLGSPGKKREQLCFPWSTFSMNIVFGWHVIQTHCKQTPSVVTLTTATKTASSIPSRSRDVTYHILGVLFGLNGIPPSFPWQTATRNRSVNWTTHFGNTLPNTSRDGCLAQTMEVTQNVHKKWWSLPQQLLSRSHFVSTRKVYCILLSHRVHQLQPRCWRKIRSTSEQQPRCRDWPLGTWLHTKRRDTTRATMWWSPFRRLSSRVSTEPMREQLQLPCGGLRVRSTLPFGLTIVLRAQPTAPLTLPVWNVERSRWLLLQTVHRDGIWCSPRCKAATPTSSRVKNTNDRDTFWK